MAWLDAKTRVVEVVILYSAAALHLTQPPDVGPHPLQRVDPNADVVVFESGLAAAPSAMPVSSGSVSLNFVFMDVALRLIERFRRAPKRATA